MEPKSNFTVKELLWRQKYPVDPTRGLTLFATVLEDDVGRRLFVYADDKRKVEGFEPDGTPIALKLTPFTTQEPSCRPEAYVIGIGDDTLPSAACRCTALGAAGVKVCWVKIGTNWVQITCPPGVC